MSNDISLKGGRNVAFRYKQGDIVAALRVALDNPKVSGDLEEVLSGLLFGSDYPEHDADAAREVLFGILEAANGLAQEADDV